MQTYKINSLEIIENSQNEFIENRKKDNPYPVLKEYTNFLINEEKYSDSLETSLFSLKNILENSDNCKVLINGQIQSGKTAFIISLISLAIDLGYRFIFFLAGTTNILLMQSFERLREIIKESKKINIETVENLKNLNLYQEKDELVIVVALKENQNLENLETISLSNNIFNEKILIIDDEADFASLNLQKNNQKKSKIHSVISSFYTAKNFISKYFGITGTPFGNLLSSVKNDLYPKYFLNLEPSKNYTGINFFENNNIYELIQQDYCQDKTKIQKMIFLFFLTAAAMKIIENTDIPNQFLFNVDLEKNQHDKLFNLIKTEISKMQNLYKILEKYSNIKEEFNYFKFSNFFGNKLVGIDSNLLFTEFKKNLFSFNLNNDLVILNSNHNIKEADVNKGIKIIIGGVMLSRGFTFENLLFEYIYNIPKNIINLDTLLQRARWFGYRKTKKRYLFMKIFMPEKAYLAYKSSADLLNIIEKNAGYNKLINANQILEMKKCLIQYEKEMKINKIGLTTKKEKNGNKTNKR